MSESVQMPALGESVTEGTVTQWLKSVGDEVEVDEPLLEVSTDKVDTEIPSPVAGVLEKILVEEDETVEVGADLAIIGSGDGASGDDDAEASGDDEGSGESSGDSSGDESSDTKEAAEAEAKDEIEEADAEAAKPEEAAADSADESLSPADAAAAQADGATDSGSGDDAGSDDSGSDDSGSDDSGSDDSGSDDSGSDESSGGSSSGGDGERTAVNLPELGESVTEGTVTQWLKSVGDEVEVDEPLLEISTDKVDTEIPSPVAGTLLEIVAEEDETVEVGKPLAYIGSGEPSSSGDSDEQTPEPAGGDDAADAEGDSGDEGETGQAQVPDEATDDDAEADAQRADASDDAGDTAGDTAGDAAPAGASEQSASEDTDAQQGSTDSGSSQQSDDGDSIGYVTPLVRKLAADKGVDLSEVSGTGVGGRIRKQDVIAAAEAAEQPEPEQPAEDEPAAEKPAAKTTEVSPLRGTRESMSRLRKIVAERMVESLQISAQLTTVVEVDVTRVAQLRARAKDEFAKREGAKLTFLPFFTLAATEALKAHPKLNASIDGTDVVYHGAENLGIAVDTERGLVVPVIKEAGDLNIAGIARKIADLASRTRANKITPDELGGGTFTITNTGSGGALFDTPILLQPQVGILGIGTIVKRPVVVEVEGSEVIAVRSMVYLALSYDHRLVDGADAARFLTTMKTRLEEGAFESDLGL